MKPVREPDAGDPQVRFDERRWETELRPSLRHRHQGESRRQQLIPQPKATAPAADSTWGRKRTNVYPLTWHVVPKTWHLVSVAQQASRQRNRPLRVRRDPREDGSGRHPPGAPATKARACPLVKPVREPDAGNPQVRFDERRWETELRPSLRHRHQGESRRQQLIPQPKATAPAVDSTLV